MSLYGLPKVFFAVDLPIFRDIFVFQKAGDDGLMPYGYNSLNLTDARAYCYGTRTDIFNDDGGIGGDLPPGSTCAEFLRRSGWEAPRDYRF